MHPSQIKLEKEKKQLLNQKGIFFKWFIQKAWQWCSFLLSSDTLESITAGFDLSWSMNLLMLSIKKHEVGGIGLLTFRLLDVSHRLTSYLSLAFMETLYCFCRSNQASSLAVLRPSEFKPLPFTASQIELLFCLLTPVAFCVQWCLKCLGLGASPLKKGSTMNKEGSVQGQDLTCLWTRTELHLINSMTWIHPNDVNTILAEFPYHTSPYG